MTPLPQAPQQTDLGIEVRFHLLLQHEYATLDEEAVREHACDGWHELADAAHFMAQAALLPTQTKSIRRATECAVSLETTIFLTPDCSCAPGVT